MTVFFYLYGLASHFGPGKQATLLAEQLRQRGHAVTVFVERPVGDDNQYLAAFRAAGAVVERPGPAAVWLEHYSWTQNLLLVLLLPLRLLLTLLDVLAHRRSFRRAWIAVRGRLNRALPALQVTSPLAWRVRDAMTRHHRQSPAHIIHSFSGKGAVFDWATRHTVAVIYNEGIVPSRQWQRDWWDDVRNYLDDVPLMLSVCAAAEPGIREVLGYRGPVRVIPCMLADTVAPTTDAKPAQYDGRIVFGAAGRLDAEKGHAFLLQAIPLVVEACPAGQIELWLAGDGPDRGRLEALVHELGISSYVRFLGHCGARDMEEFWRGIDVFVLPSLWEGLPNVILEAMMHAKPVIASDVGGVGEAVVAGTTGLLVPPRCPRALADAMIRLGQSEPVRGEMGQAGRQRFEANYLPEPVTAQYLSAYREAASLFTAVASKVDSGRQTVVESRS